MQSQNGNGALAERLGTGLQNLLQRFDSARHLSKTPLEEILEGFVHFILPNITHIPIWNNYLYVTVPSVIIVYAGFFCVDIVVMDLPLYEYVIS